MCPLCSAKDVAEYLGVNIQTVWQWAREGSIPCYKLGSSYRFKLDDIDRWIEKKRVKNVIRPFDQNVS